MSKQANFSYTENFADIANWANNFAAGTGASAFKGLAVAGTATIPDPLRITASTTTFATGSTGGVQRGTGNILLLSTGSTDNSTSAAIDLYADYSGVNAGKISFDWSTVFNSTGDRRGSLRVYTSTNGTTFTELTAAAVLNFVNNVASSGSIANIELPASFNNTATCILRFYYHNGSGGTTGSRPKISLDNINLTATAISGADLVKPTVSTYFPANNATVSNLSVVPKLRFSEDIQKGTGNITVNNLTDNSSQVISITNSNNTIIGKDLSLTNLSFTNGKSYAIQLEAGTVKDLADTPNNFDGILNNTTWSFIINANPLAVTDNFIVYMNEALNESVASNDSDPNNSNLSYSILNQPVSGSVSLNSNGTFVYTPASNFTGVASFTYRVTNASSFTSDATVNLTVMERSKLIISQIYEGTGTNKWVELTNLSNSTINTTTPQLKLALYNVSGDASNINFNNATVPTNTVNLSFSVPARNTVIIGNTGNGTEVTYINSAQIVQTSNSVVNFNGNDGVALLDANNNIIDAFGQGINAKDKSFVRNQTVISGSNSFVASDWTELSLLTVQEADDVNEPNRLGSHIPANLTPCVSPSTAPTNLVFGTPGNNRITGSFTATVADEYLIIRSTSSNFTGTITNGTTYIVNDVIGNGTVISRSGSTLFSTSNLSNGTMYYFYIYALNSTSCTGGPLYSSLNLSGNQSTTTPPPCNAPTAQPTAFTIDFFGYNFVQGSFIGSIADEYLVVMSTNTSLNATPINGTTYFVNDDLGGVKVIKRGSGNTFSKTGLTPSTTYYFNIYAINSNCTGGPIYQLLAPLQGNQTTSVYDVNALNYYYGNLHSHSGSSDGNKDDLTKTVADNFNFAKTADKMDFLGISEHNHTAAGMDITRWDPGVATARSVTDANFVALYGMEWGTISGGGHVIVYGIDSLINWETNQSQIYVPKSTYTGSNGLFRIVNRHGLNAIAYLAHPSNSDYNNIRGTLDLMADSAVVGAAVESGPAFSTNTTYSNPASSLAYLSYYQDMLAKGYHLGPIIDHDNHNFTFGKTAKTRLAILSPTLTENDLLASMKAMRFYATQDYAAQVKFTINTQPLGSILKSRNAPNIEVSVLTTTTPVTSIKLMHGVPGSGFLATVLATSASTTLTYTDNALPNLSTGYYYVDIIETDGTRIITSPIWYNRDDNVVLPITLKSFTAKAHSDMVDIKWLTSSESNNHFFTIERSIDGKNFSKIGEVKGAGNSSQILNYLFKDIKPYKGVNYYRLRQTDFDGKFTYSNIIAVNLLSGLSKEFNIYPNPAQGIVTLSLNTDAKDLVLKVIDTNGKIVLQGKGNVMQMNQLLNNNLSSLISGIYLLKLNNNTEAYATKLLKQ